MSRMLISGRRYLLLVLITAVALSSMTGCFWVPDHDHRDEHRDDHHDDHHEEDGFDRR